MTLLEGGDGHHPIPGPGHSGSAKVGVIVRSGCPALAWLEGPLALMSTEGVK